MLFDPLESTRPSDHPLQGHKFHLRAYVLLTGTYKLYLSRTLLALFSSEAFSMPGSSITSDSDFSVVDGDGLTPHLTNTCLQASAVDPSISLDDYVKLFWEIEGMNLLSMGTSSSRQGFESKGKITKEWLEGTFEKVGKVIAETVQGAVECGSFGMQLLENAFEVRLYLNSLFQSFFSLLSQFVLAHVRHANPDNNQKKIKKNEYLFGSESDYNSSSASTFFSLSHNLHQPTALFLFRPSRFWNSTPHPTLHNLGIVLVPNWEKCLKMLWRSSLSRSLRFRARARARASLRPRS